MIPQLALLGVALATQPARASALESRYTGIRSDQCHAESSELRQEYPEPQFFVAECPALPGYRLFVVEDENRSWVVLKQADDYVWPREAGEVQSNPRFFPNVAESPSVEWRVDEDETPRALIYRMVHQTPNDSEENLSQWYVVRLNDAGPCLLGIEGSNSAARVLADSTSGCKQ